MGGAGAFKPSACAALAALLAAPVHGEDVSRPRLMGVVIGPQTREAVLADGKHGRRTTVVSDGAAFGGFTVNIVDPETVVLVGPSGVITLLFGAEADPRGQPPPTFPKAEATNAGASVGRLAIGRDDCARAGLLPGVRADTETRLRELIDVASNLPGRPGGQIARLAPSQFELAGMSAGLPATEGRFAKFASDRAGCAALEARWKRVAGRWGLL